MFERLIPSVNAMVQQISKGDVRMSSKLSEIICLWLKGGFQLMLEVLAYLSYCQLVKWMGINEQMYSF